MKKRELARGGVSGTMGGRGESGEPETIVNLPPQGRQKKALFFLLVCINVVIGIG